MIVSQGFSSFEKKQTGSDDCGYKAFLKSQQSLSTSNENTPKRTRNIRTRRQRFRFTKNMKVEGTSYNLITSIDYLNEKYGIRKTHYIEKFLKCIHKKMDQGVNKITDSYAENLSPWVKVKFFLLLVMLSQRGGPEYWMDKNDQEKDPNSIPRQKQQHEDKFRCIDLENKYFSLTEHIMRRNINHDFTEQTYDENYVFSSIWANFMEGLINHYLEQIIVPRSEMKVCQQLYKPMMKIISLYNEYNELMEKSERNGFLPSTVKENVKNNEKTVSKSNGDNHEDFDQSEGKDNATKERLQRAQKLLWQARQDIPKTISKELTLLSEMYSTLSADEQDYELDEFVCCAEEYIELEYLPSLIDVLFANCGTMQFWKIMIVLEPFFYYIEDVGDDIGEDENEDEDEDEDEEEEEEDEDEDEVVDDSTADDNYSTSLANNDDAVFDRTDRKFKPDQRVVILEKICEVAARQKWI